MPSYKEIGAPPHASKALLHAAGRERLGFEAAYVSDYGGVETLAKMHQIATDLDEAAIPTLDAGVAQPRAKSEAELGAERKHVAGRAAGVGVVPRDRQARAVVEKRT